MLAVVHNVLQELCHFEPGDRLIVGVSGGPDSLALMLLLCELDWKPIIAHLNHQLRPAANEEEEGVCRWAEQIGVPFISQRVDVADYARQHSLSIEEAARYCRYRFLFEQAERRRAKAVLVAHTADDQVETVLMRLLRGAGRQGLSGMRIVALPNPWSATIPLVRPLLSVWRAQIMDYLHGKGIIPFTDESNLDNAYTRNRIRNELLPYMETYNPAIRKALWQTAQILADEEEVLQRQEESAWEDAMSYCSEDIVGFNLSKFRQFSPAIRRRIVRRAWRFLQGDLVDLEFAQVEQVINLFLSNRIGRQQITDKLACLIYAGQGYLLKGNICPPNQSYPQLQARQQEVLLVPLSGIFRLDRRWILQIERVVDQPYQAMRESKVGPFEAWLDYEVCKRGLFIRPPKEGDRFAPLSMQGQTIKVSDIFINRKIPVWIRKAYPLICNDSEILWMPGYTICHSARLTPESQEAIHLMLLKAEVETDDLAFEN